jgi:hypothetical protein
MALRLSWRTANGANALSLSHTHTLQVVGQRRGSLSAVTGRPRNELESEAKLQQAMKLQLDALLAR